MLWSVKRKTTTDYFWTIKVYSCSVSWITISGLFNKMTTFSDMLKKVVSSLDHKERFFLLLFFWKLHQLFLTTPGVQTKLEIFAISLSLSKIFLFLNFQFLNSVQYTVILSEHGFYPPELRSIGIFRISLTVFLNL